MHFNQNKTLILENNCRHKAENGVKMCFSQDGYNIAIILNNITTFFLNNIILLMSNKLYSAAVKTIIPNKKYFLIIQLE